MIKSIGTYSSSDVSGLFFCHSRIDFGRISNIVTDSIKPAPSAKRYLRNRLYVECSFDGNRIRPPTILAAAATIPKIRSWINTLIAARPAAAAKVNRISTAA